MKQLITLDSPLFVKWYITSRCNLRCKHCYLSSFKNEINLSKSLELIDELSDIGVKYISFLGGEPLVRKDLEKIINHCEKTKISTNIATNGTLLTERRISSLLESGANDFQISIEGENSLINDSIRGTNSFNKAIAGAKRLVAHNINTQIAMTLNKQNMHSISNVCDMLISNGIRRVKFSAFMPLGNGLSNQDDYILNDIDIGIIKKEIIKNKKNIEIIGSFNDINNKKQCATLGCGAGTSTLVLNSDMTVSACDLWTETDHTVRKIEKKGDILDIWRNDKIFDKWRRKLDTTDDENLKSQFSEVHEHGCHILFMQYQKNIFEN